MKKEKLDIIYEDKYIIVINKKSGLLTIGTIKEKENTLYHQVLMYVKKQNKNNRIFIVHRLDKDTSGLIIFAKGKIVKNKLQLNWDNVIRKYYALVHGKIEKDNDILKSYLRETKTYYVYSTKNSKNSKLAITEYERLKYTNKYSLLKVNIKTGRKHQIRVQLNDIKHPIVGDNIYAKVQNKGIKRMCLHAYYLEFNHPITNRLMILETKIPEDFLNLIK